MHRLIRMGIITMRLQIGCIVYSDMSRLRIQGHRLTWVLIMGCTDCRWIATSMSRWPTMGFRSCLVNSAWTLMHVQKCGNHLMNPILV